MSVTDKVLDGHGAPGTRGPGRKSWLTQSRAPYVFLSPMLVLFAVFKIYPFASSIWISMTTSKGGQGSFSGLDNYIRLSQDPTFYVALRNTGFFLITYVPLLLVASLLLSVALNSALLKLSSLFRLVYFLPIVMGLVAYGVLFSGLFNSEFGIVNRLLALLQIPAVNWFGEVAPARFTIVIAMLWHYVGFYAVIYLAQLQSIDPVLYEAASIDGANALQKFRAVTLPGLRPAITLTLILASISTLQLFDEPYVLTNGGPDDGTLTIGMYLYENGFRYFDFGYASAIGWVLAIIIGIISLVQFVLVKGEEK